MFNRKVQRQKRHLRLRQRIVGTAARPRMSICLSNKNIYVQFIDDDAQRTLAQANTLKIGQDNITVKLSLSSGATAVNSVHSRSSEDGACYSLNGQKVENPSKGIYIRNGKKVMLNSTSTWQ